MVSSNPVNLEIKDLDPTFSIAPVKPFPATQKYVSSASSSFSAVLMENPGQSETTIKLIKDAYSSPVKNPTKSKKKLYRGNKKPAIHQEKLGSRNKSYSENRNINKNVQKVADRPRYRNHLVRNTKSIYRKERPPFSPVIDSFESKTKETEIVTTSGKRKLDINNIKENPSKKKVHIEEPAPPLFEEDDQDITSLIRILDDDEANMHLGQPEEHHNSTGININTKTANPEPKISNVGPGNNSSQHTQISPTKTKMGRKNSMLITKDLHLHKPIIQEADHSFDLFGLDDGLGIKILDEVFLCQFCHNQIHQDKVGTGMKDVCLNCQRKGKHGHRGSEHKTLLSEAYVESESDFIQPLPSRILGHTAENEYGIHQFDSHLDELIDILNPIYNNDKKLLCVGRNYQAEITSLGLYDDRPRRDIKRLWNPSRVDLPAFERFRIDINTKNSTQLLDEEVSEILVRNECDVDKALEWSTKGNPEFQAYVKRSSNRRRLITKMGPIKF